MNDQCVRCGAIQWLAAEHILQNGKKLPKIECEVNLRPHAVVYKNPVRREIKMRFCGNCGAVEWNINNPQELWLALKP